MNQKNIIIGLGVLVVLLLLFSLTNRHYLGWGMMGSFNDEMHEEMEEHMHDDSDHEHDDDDGHFHDEMGEHMHDDDDDSLDTSTSADNAPPGSMHNLPVPEAVAAVRTKVATELGISEGVVIVMTAFEEVWLNGCLGLAVADEMCTEALVSGYEVTVLAQGEERVFRTNSNGSAIREEK